MATEIETANRSAIHSYCEAVSAGDLDALDELLDPDVVHHSASMSGQKPGSKGVLETVSSLRKSFSHFTMVVTDTIAEGDRVAFRCNVSGTHTGDLTGAPPTGKSFEFEEIDIARFRDGHVVEIWSHPDSLALQRQLGLA